MSTNPVRQPDRPKWLPVVNLTAIYDGAGGKCWQCRGWKLTIGMDGICAECQAANQAAAKGECV
jgi:hypothetical protein